MRLALRPEVQTTRHHNQVKTNEIVGGGKGQEMEIAFREDVLYQESYLALLRRIVLSHRNVEERAVHVCRALA